MAQFSAIAENVQTMDQLDHLRIKAKRLKFLNLHGNNIRLISNIDHCYYLEELDLSSNKIETISGLEACESLLKLNLSCNQLRLATGLDFLYNLKTLNLSYNKVSNVKSLTHFSEKRFQLENLFLHGNKLSSVPATAGSLKKILSLRHITLHSNPLCSNANYRKVFGDCMPQLETLDDFPRTDDSFSESVTTESSTRTQPIATPFIDKAIRNFKNDSEPESDVNYEVVEIPHKGKAVDCNGICESDYTDLIKQVLTIIREEEVPVKLEKNEEAQPVSDETLEADVSRACQKSPKEQATEEQKTETPDIAALHSTNQLLLTELETERERRWKSEKHISDLSDKLVRNDSAIKEYEVLNRSSEAGINGIRDLLMKEQSQKMKLANLLETFKDKHKDVVGVLAQRESTIKEGDVEIHRLHQVVEGMKRSSSETVKHHQLSLQQVRQEAQVQRKQCELLRHGLDNHEIQVKSLQELIVKREQEHVKEKDNLVPLHGEMFNKRVDELVQNEREKHKLMNKNIIDSARSWQKKYMELEKEFRMALYLENKRYEELHSPFSKVSEQNSIYRSELNKLKGEASKNTLLIEKLKCSITEQSEAIDKLSRSRKDIEERSKIRISALEKELEETTKNVIELSSLQKDNTVLKGDVAAHQSVIEGLRSERELWSRELSEQGAQISLKNGTLRSEIGCLKKQNSDHLEAVTSMRDCLRIKEVQINDANDTISKLKDSISNSQKNHLEEISQLEANLKQVSDEQEDAETRVEAIRQALCASQQDKDDIMEKCEHSANERDSICRKYKELKQQWENKVGVFEKVEKTAQEMTKTHEEQIRELNAAIDDQKERIQKLEKELRTVRENHELRFKQRESEFHDAAEKASREFEARERKHSEQVVKLEQEMRAIIHQSQQLKQENDAKLSKLAGALGEFTVLLKPK